MNQEEEQGEIYAKSTEGKYSDECAALLAMLGAEVALLVVRGGPKGDGFSLAIDQRKAIVPQVLANVPRVLRSVADAIERQEAERKAGQS